MTREEFTRAFAKRCGVSDQWAALGFIEAASRTKIAMPCACEYSGCEGWAMLSIEFIDHHLEFNAPKKLREAYQEAIADIPVTRNIDHVEESLAKQLESSIAKNSRMVSRLKALVDQILPLAADPEMEDLRDDLVKILNDQDPLGEIQ